MNFRAWAFIVLASVLGCEGWQSELVKSEDYEPLLNVLAILSPDEGGVAVVQVMQTLPPEGSTGHYGEPDTVCTYYEYYDTTFCHEHSPWISYYEVDNASVTLFDGHITYDFEYDSTRYDRGGERYYTWRYASDYVPVDTTFIPRTGVTYELSVATPEGLAVSGSCTIPPPVTIRDEEIPDTLRSGETFGIAWVGASDYVRAVIETVRESEYDGQTCYIWEEAIVRGDSSWTFQVVPECWEEVNTPDQSIVVEIRVLAMDERYYDYFVGDEIEAGVEEMTFLFLGEGDTGRCQGIEGGLGVFASYRVSSTRRFLKL